MAKDYDDADGVWRTIGGRRVFIKKGQSLSDAMKESGKFKSAKKGLTDEEKKMNDTNDKIAKHLDNVAKVAKEMGDEKLAKTNANAAEYARSQINNEEYIGDIPKKSYDIADEIEEKFGDKEVITRDEFEEFLTGKYDDEDADIRGILAQNGWETKFESDDEGNEGDLVRLKDNKDVSSESTPKLTDRDAKDLLKALNDEGSDFTFDEDVKIEDGKIKTNVGVFMPDERGYVERELEIPLSENETYDSLEEKMRDWEDRHSSPDSFEDEDFKRLKDQNDYTKPTQEQEIERQRLISELRQNTSKEDYLDFIDQSTKKQISNDEIRAKIDDAKSKSSKYDDKYRGNDYWDLNDAYIDGDMDKEELANSLKDMYATEKGANEAYKEITGEELKGTTNEELPEKRKLMGYRINEQGKKELYEHTEQDDELGHWEKDKNGDRVFVKNPRYKEELPSDYYDNLEPYEVYEQADKLANETNDYSLRKEINKRLDRIDRANAKGSGYGQKPTNELREILKNNTGTAKLTNETMNEKIRSGANKKSKELASNSGQERISKDTKVMRSGDDYIVLQNGANKGEYKTQDEAEKAASALANSKSSGAKQYDAFKGTPYERKYKSVDEAIKDPNSNMNKYIREKASKKSTYKEDLPQRTEIKSQGTSNRKEVSENIQAYILDYYTPDFTGDDNLSASQAFIEQMEYMNEPTMWKAGERLAEGGSYDVYTDDMRKFLDDLKINPKGKDFDDDRVFQTYKSLIGRESAKLYDRLIKNEFNKYKQEHPLTKMTLEEYKDSRKKK